MRGCAAASSAGLQHVHTGYVGDTQLLLRPCAGVEIRKRRLQHVQTGYDGVTLLLLRPCVGVGGK